MPSFGWHRRVRIRGSTALPAGSIKFEQFRVDSINFLCSLSGGAPPDPPREGAQENAQNSSKLLEPAGTCWKRDRASAVDPPVLSATCRRGWGPS
eukprot:6718572-Alexandrium_andersonii.AAC.1